MGGASRCGWPQSLLLCLAGRSPARDLLATDGPFPRREKLRLAGAGPANSDTVSSPIQGTVAAVRATPGMAVAAGTVLFVIEAMKMENEIAAPRAGTVKAVMVAERDSVGAGQTLAILDEAREPGEAREARE